VASGVRAYRRSGAVLFSLESRGNVAKCWLTFRATPGWQDPVEHLAKVSSPASRSPSIIDQHVRVSSSPDAAHSLANV